MTSAINTASGMSVLDLIDGIQDEKMHTIALLQLNGMGMIDRHTVYNYCRFGSEGNRLPHAKTCECGGTA